MSYNMVLKAKAGIVVKKFRDVDNKVREQYIMSLGTMSDQEFGDFRTRFNEQKQEDRIEFAARSRFYKETTDDTPRRKIVDQAVTESKTSKKKATRSKKVKTVKKKVVKDYPVSKPSIEAKERETIKGMKVSQYKTVTAKKAAIDTRISEIRSVIDDQEIYLIHYKAQLGRLSATEKRMREDEAEKYINYKIEGLKAIKILQEQKIRLSK